MSRSAGMRGSDRFFARSRLAIIGLIEFLEMPFNKLDL